MKNTPMKKTQIALAVASLFTFTSMMVHAAPEGGNVVAGQASIQRQGGNTSINQASQRAIINWQSFNIGASERVLHNMPNAGSHALHRVVGGGGASQLAGELRSNGNVYLVNPAGVVIHKGARIDVGGFLASTHNISDADFMAGHLNFNQPGRPGAVIINLGQISVKDSGFAALVAPTVRNDGIIVARLGRIALASGNSYTLDFHGDELITFTAPEPVVNGLYNPEGEQLGVTNNGQIKAEGGVVLLTASQLDGIVKAVVNNGGTISAASAELEGGKIVFRAEGAVNVVNTGSLDASSGAAGGMVRVSGESAVNVSGTVTATGETGGRITVTGEEVTLSNANLDASGATGGGTVLVGGNAMGQGPEKNAENTSVAADVSIRADATQSGDGGQVVVWSDGTTTFAGSISAKGGAESGNGGWVETSGHVLNVPDTARVNTSAANGRFGEWLLDPVDYVIAASGGNMTGNLLSSNLATGNVTILSSHSGGSGGDIFVNDAVRWVSNTRLTLSADRDVHINANITATGDTAGLEINPGSGGAYALGNNAKVTLSGANPSLSIAGYTYTVINSLTALQDMAGRCALGSDIDASATSGWNGGAGFEPIGNGSHQFGGVFDGLGHTITNLTIYRPTTNYVGLFGSVEHGTIRNVGLVNAHITGNRYVGGLMGGNNNYGGTLGNL